MQPDYSRQLSLKEIGPKGQAALGAARVLIVGLGGLGSPVMQYLAGAGVGFMSLIDADVLDASNLHRQPIYGLVEAGEPKAQLARAAILKINPTVQVRAHQEPLGPDNAMALIADHDLVIDCTDNFRAKYLINDAAVLARKPAIFASVYQYEGQLQVYKPDSRHACLRCLWPEGTRDGLVGNCAEAGVLGPVPGTLGTMQALVALKILLQMNGQLEEELLLLDFTHFTTLKIKAPRLAECAAPACAHILALPREIDGLGIDFPSLAAAAAAGFEIIDIRSAEEVAASPAPARNVPMPELIANPRMLADGRRTLLVCASGKRSLATAEILRKHGVAVRSLSGGLNKLEP